MSSAGGQGKVFVPRSYVGAADVSPRDAADPGRRGGRESGARSREGDLPSPEVDRQHLVPEEVQPEQAGTDALAGSV